ncbi:aldotetraouronic acid ABC transporter membrane protein 1 [Paenibacillus cellulosilyticus]|uniref:Aldotetraouronic acid ABC transporter membrane protein 1 n=1 Tax=Paenibacillus cellulosilyticus TaxID=375489 RepID=A0A2V2YQS3_9BACL|nr:ABC transporter permease subunit [Paenibacillus cellulosilyticus]PWV99512.1 aldotetraouronic acid ABC transporter membrane protein 1 [Paenibacillus cellulosilyticus]QKS44765.1 sugar ABC transporter permease [Paenibacillus cellulosilyticus]
MENDAMLTTSPSTLENKPTGLKLFFTRLVQQRMLVLMSIPFVIWLIIFKYVPIWGWTIAFQDYQPGLKFSEQKWVGFKHFKILFTDETFSEQFLRAVRNTLAMSGINLILGFVTAITLALLLNEVKKMAFKRVVQTVSYLPHFISWVVAAGIIQTTLAPDGIINELLKWIGVIDKGQEYLFLGKAEWFWGIFGASSVWKDIGWNAIVYLAAISSIDPAQYEAAEMDGAGRLRRMWSITLPGIKPVIIVLLIMNIGYLMESGFEPQYLLGNGMNVDYSENIDIFVLKYGLQQFNFPLATAAGMFKTVVSFILLFAANNVAKRMGQDRLF